MRYGWKSGGAGAAKASQWLVGAAGALAVWLMIAACAASHVSARPSQHIVLQLAAPESCPSAQELLERVDLQLGAEFETDSQLRATAEVRALGPSDFELLLHYESDSGASDQRSLRGESCLAVTDAAVLVLALVLNPSAALEDPAEPVASAVRSEPAESTGSPPERRAILAARFGVLGVLDTPLMQRTSLAAGLQLGLRVGPIELHVRGQFFPARSASRAETTTTFSAYSFDLLVCSPWQIGRFALGPCVRAEVGRLAADAQGSLEAQAPGAARFQALGLGAEVRVRVMAPLWLSLGGDFAWILRRPQFVVTDLGEVLRPSKFGARVYVGPLLAW